MGIKSGNTPLVKMYLGDTKIAKAYIGSKEIYPGGPSWPGYIYNAGDEFADLTDGWVMGYQNLTSGTVFTKYADSMYLSAGGSTWREIACTTNIKVDLTNISKLYIDWKNTGIASSLNQSFFVVGSLKTDRASVYTVGLTESNVFARMESELDVSSLTGEYYIRVHAYDISNSADRTSTITIYGIWGI